jgi:hypothetical protein
MRRLYLLAALLAACSGDDAATREKLEKLRSRRAALGLDPEPLAMAEAMQRIEKAGYEAALVRGDLGLDDALRLENLLVRAQPGAIPEGMLHRARRLVSEYVHALAGGERPTTGPLVRSCVDCHLKYRE